MKLICPYCHGGRVLAEARSTVTHRCPDCEGTGVLFHCDGCGLTFDASCDRAVSDAVDKWHETAPCPCCRSEVNLVTTLNDVAERQNEDV